MSSGVQIAAMWWSVSCAVWTSCQSRSRLSRRASLLSRCQFCVYGVWQQKAAFIFQYQDNCSLMQCECNFITQTKRDGCVCLRAMFFVNQTGEKINKNDKNCLSVFLFAFIKVGSNRNHHSKQISKRGEGEWKGKASGATKVSFHFLCDMRPRWPFCRTGLRSCCPDSVTGHAGC